MKITFIFVLVCLITLIVSSGCASHSTTVTSCKTTIEKVYTSLDTNKKCLETETGKKFCAYDDFLYNDAFTMLSSSKFLTGQSYILMLQSRQDPSTNNTELVVTKIYTMQTAQNTIELKDITNSCG